MLRPFHILRGSPLSAADGEIGKISEFYFDDGSWLVRYLVVETGSWLTGRKVLIAPRALGAIDASSGAIGTLLTQEQVRNAPPVETDQPVSQQDEERLHHHYAWDPYWGDPGAGPGMMLVPSALAPPPAFAPPPVASENLAPEEPPVARNPHLRSSAELLSCYTMHAQDGEIGLVKDFIVDAAGWHVRYVVIHTGMLFLGKDVLLAPEWIERIADGQAEVFVNLPRSAIKDAPAYHSAEPLDRAFEQRLHDHYSRKGYWEAVRKPAPYPRKSRSRF